MATMTINSITLDYPNDPCMVFNPCPLKVTGTLSALRVYINTGQVSYYVTFDTPNGGIIDIREYLQSFFESPKLGDDLDYTQAVKVSELGKSISFTVMAIAADGTTLAQFNLTIFCVWGAVNPNEELFVHRKIKRFGSLPLIVGVYGNNAGGGTINVVDVDDANNASLSTVNAQGLYNALVGITPTGNTIEVYYNFTRLGHPVKVKMYTVECVDDCGKDVVYLRWIDRWGCWCHWLFKTGDEARGAEGRGLFNRNDLNLYDRIWQWHGNSSRRQNYARQDVIPVCAPLVDSETFDFLQDVTTSPVVDMYIGESGYTPMWMPVTIEPGTYTKEARRPEQDFIMNIVLPETNIQQL